MPGPAPAYRPVFPPAFLAQAKRMVRQRIVAFQVRQRANLVLLLHQPPLLSNTAAAAQVQLHPNSVCLWRQRWARGDFVLEDKAGRGRKPLFSPRDEAIGQAVACEAVYRNQLPLSRLSLAELTTQAHVALGQPISCNTIRRILDTAAIKTVALRVLDLSP